MWIHNINPVRVYVCLFISKHVSYVYTLTHSHVLFVLSIGVCGVSGDPERALWSHPLRVLRRDRVVFPESGVCVRMCLLGEPVLLESALERQERLLRLSGQQITTSTSPFWSSLWTSSETRKIRSAMTRLCRKTTHDVHNVHIQQVACV